MNTEKTVKICGKDVRLRYCIASETGFEVMSGKEINVFLPTNAGKDENGNIIYAKAKATTDDYLRLAIASIIAAYERDGQEPPVTVNEILYDAAPEGIANLITATVELRMKWYHIADVVKPETQVKEEDNEKNA